ncbi:dihydroxyacetone kinase, DhaK subunit [Enterococcus canis]|uniref:phosphoenolpyruvate--glycerone phosphotransferase n=1 Tax=Enterococcus canis TaxID=214095 RepID=A0A1L8RI14_9ENTE|nr:dihydroxyacetone kinase, DhaK subunit [Enterococcus canis]
MYVKKIINAPADVVDEMLKGLTEAYPTFVKRLPDTSVIARLEQAAQVGLVSGGGSGHEPAHAGFVGDGMLSAAVCGQVFTSPTPDQIFEAIKDADQGKGVLLIVKNYSGDVMNFEMAQDMASMEDIETGFVLVDDDIAVENSTYTQGKRGVAGTILVHKILGAYARNGASVTQLADLGKELVENIKTIGIALTGATVPEVGKPGFTLGDDEIEYGVGIHGEPGYRREKIKTSHEMAEEIVSKLKAAFEWQEGEKYGVLVNGMGGTPLMEQFIFFQDVKQLLGQDGLEISFSKVGNYMTSLEMQGLSLTLIKTKEEWVAALNEEVHTISW